MKITSVKELEKLLKLCRKQGVTNMKVDAMEFTLGALPKASVNAPAPISDVFPEASIQVPAYNGAPLTEDHTPDTISLPDQLTEEALMLWSATGEQQ